MNKDLSYLTAAYMVLWGINFGYIFFMGRKQADLKRELDELKRIAESD